jgi:hypothetical protein
MRLLRILSLLAGSFLASLGGSAQAAVVSLDAIQTGGFYAGGATPDNLPGFQNYFVGYGTSPGGARTPERRSFFWFSLAGISTPIVSAKLDLTLPFGGLIFGAGPVDPTVGDAMELFQLGATGFTPGDITSPSDLDAIFAGLAAFPIAAPVCFDNSTDGVDACPGPMPPPPPVVIDIGPSGLAFLNGHLGTDVILSGWMPTWSFDSRPDPSPPPDFLEAGELIFGLTDVVSPFGSSVDPPKLVLTTEAAVAVPEANTLSLLAIGLFGLRVLRRRVPPG